MRTTTATLLLLLTLIVAQSCSDSANQQFAEGSYKGESTGTDISLSLSNSGANKQSVHADVSVTNSAGCSGELSGQGLLAGNILRIIPDGNDNENGNCIVTVTFSGTDSATITESKCSSYHGVNCSFSGALKKSETISDSPKQASLANNPNPAANRVNDVNQPKSNSFERIASQVRSPDASTAVGRAIVGEENTFNHSLSNLEVTKNVNSGILNIKVRIDHPQCAKCAFIVRLFDKNGNYLAHFMTENLLHLFGPNVLMAQSSQNADLSFSVDIRDLRDTDIVEFGFYLE